MLRTAPILWKNRLFIPGNEILNGSLTVIAALFGVFLDCLELLVAFLQAYVFTMLSSVFIGLAHQKPAHETN